MKKTFLLVLIALICGFNAFAVPFHVTHLWHMHQPIYWPYENAVVADSNGRMPYSILNDVFDGDRQNAYQYWPPASVSYAHDRGMPHAGSQVNFSGSLGENCEALGYNKNEYRSAKNDKRTTLNNPRLDIVGFGYHHSLMPLTCKESMIMQIKLHKEQYFDRWATSEYSKGFWPPECAFEESMIPALVAEGLEWVIVDNGHLFRTISDFQWNSASSCKPNAADVNNGSSTDLASQWVNLNDMWAPTAVLAPWAYQPHNVQYVDPETGNIQKIIAVPAGRYEGNEYARGGYGAFKLDNVWGGHNDKNTDANHPMMILTHTDGDNYGMKNNDAWHGQHNSFLDLVQGNGNYEYTSIQDYLDMYPPSPSDVVHVEPGSWIGIDGGTPYYEKWLSQEYENGQNPDRWSWSVIVAAQNRVILADSLDNNYSMNDVEWGLGNDTAKAWHWYLNAETSCYWYWDNSGEPWDGHATRACNEAVNYAMNVINAHGGTDNKGPSIFPPQRNYYNPGSYMWDPNDTDPSDFTVWSYVDDVSGLQSVTLKWRTDKDGHNPIHSTQNETFAGGDEVNPWNSVTMSGSWDPANKVSVCPDANARAQMYKGDITGQNNVLIDYYIEAVDSKGNIAKSDIIHVVVGEVGEAPDPELYISGVSYYPGPSHADNSTLEPGEDLWADAYTGGATPTSVTVSYSVNNGTWNTVSMDANGDGAWNKNLGSYSDGDCIAFNVTATDGTVTKNDDNNGANYTICAATPVPDFVVTDPDPVPHTVPNGTASYVVKGTCNTSIYGNSLLWTNTANGQSGSMAIAQTWSIASAVPLAVGNNEITVTATADSSGTASDSSEDNAYASGWSSGSNGGSGFSAWTLNGGANSVFSIATSGDSPNLSIGPSAWCMAAHSDDLAEAIRPLSSPLAVGDTLSVKLDNNYVSQGKGFGIAMQNAAGETLWQFWFNGGDTNYNMTGIADTGMDWSGDGMEIAFTLDSATSFETVISPAGRNDLTLSGDLDTKTDNNISRFRTWNYSTGNGTDYNVYLDNLTVTPLVGGASVSTSITFTIIRESSGTDTDADGITDAWEIQHFGSIGACDPDSDHDGDGHTNIEEFWTGSQPTNPDSILEFGDDCLMTNGKPSYSWKTVGGKTYIIQCCDDFHSDTFKTIATITEDDVADGVESTESYTDTAFPSDAKRRYYRIMLQKP